MTSSIARDSLPSSQHIDAVQLTIETKPSL